MAGNRSNKGEGNHSWPQILSQHIQHFARNKPNFYHLTIYKSDLLWNGMLSQGFYKKKKVGVTVRGGEREAQRWKFDIWEAAADADPSLVDEKDGRVKEKSRLCGKLKSGCWWRSGVQEIITVRRHWHDVENNCPPSASASSALLHRMYDIMHSSMFSAFFSYLFRHSLSRKIIVKFALNVKQK